MTSVAGLARGMPPDVLPIRPPSLQIICELDFAPFRYRQLASGCWQKRIDRCWQPVTDPSHVDRLNRGYNPLVMGNYIHECPDVEHWLQSRKVEYTDFVHHPGTETYSVTTNDLGLRTLDRLHGIWRLHTQMFWQEEVAKFRVTFAELPHVRIPNPAEVIYGRAGMWTITTAPSGKMTESYTYYKMPHYSIPGPKFYEGRFRPLITSKLDILPLPPFTMPKPVKPIPDEPVTNPEPPAPAPPDEQPEAAPQPTDIHGNPLKVCDLVKVLAHPLEHNAVKLPETAVIIDIVERGEGFFFCSINEPPIEIYAKRLALATAPNPRKYDMYGTAIEVGDYARIIACLRPERIGHEGKIIEILPGETTRVIFDDPERYSVDIGGIRKIDPPEPTLPEKNAVARNVAPLDAYGNLVEHGDLVQIVRDTPRTPPEKSRVGLRLHVEYITTIGKPPDAILHHLHFYTLSGQSLEQSVGCPVENVQRIKETHMQKCDGCNKMRPEFLFEDASGYCQTCREKQFFTVGQYVEIIVTIPDAAGYKAGMRGHIVDSLKPRPDYWAYRVEVNGISHIVPEHHLRAHMPAVYLWGYTGQKPETLKKIAEDLDATVYDARYSARSRVPKWTNGGLLNLLGDRYRHVRDWGNRNYKGGPIDIADYDAGRAILQKETRPAIIIICVCDDPAKCHRTTVGNMLRADGYTVKEYDLKPKQVTLF